LAVERVLVALLYIVAGAVKLIYYTGTLGYLTKIGVPLPDVALPLVILIELAGGIAVAIGWQLRFVAPVLAAFTLLAAFRTPLLGGRSCAVHEPALQLPEESRDHRRFHRAVPRRSQERASRLNTAAIVDLAVRELLSQPQSLPALGKQLGYCRARRFYAKPFA